MIPIIANIFPLCEGSLTTVIRPSSERIKPIPAGGSENGKQQNKKNTKEAILRQKPKMQIGRVPRLPSEKRADDDGGMVAFDAEEPPPKNSANSGALPIGTQTSLPSSLTRLVSINLCSKIQRLISSLSIGPYSLPSLPITLYIFRSPLKNYHPPNGMKRKNNVPQKNAECFYSRCR